MHIHLFVNLKVNNTNIPTHPQKEIHIYFILGGEIIESVLQYDFFLLYTHNLDTTWNTTWKRKDRKHVSKISVM